MIKDDRHRDCPLLAALGITVATTAAPLPRPVWVASHRILVVSHDVSEDDLLAAAWEATQQAA